MGKALLTQDPEHREIDALVGPEQVRAPLLSVGEDDLEGRAVLDHVVVRHDQTIRANHDARALLGPASAASPRADLHHRLRGVLGGTLERPRHPVGRFAGVELRLSGAG